MARTGLTRSADGATEGRLAATPAQPGTRGRGQGVRPAPARGRPARPAALLAPAAVMLGLGLWGLDRGTMWRDEAATFDVARRSLPQMWHLFGSVDAVHGLYYLLMRPVLALRADELALRLPSVAASAATAALVGAIGCRLAGPRVGLWAGLLFAGTPFVSHYAQEGRSYALVTTGAALATWLLVRAVEHGSAGRWAAYGAAAAGAALLHEFAALLLAAHALTLLTGRVPWRTWRGWGAAALAVCAVLVPLVLRTRGQSGQVSWLRTPGYAEAKALVRSFAGPGGLVLVVTLALIAVAVLAPRPRVGVLHPTAVALPWAVVPPVLLYTVSQSQPLFYDRYLLFCVPGVPLLAATGADRLLGAVRRRRLVTAAGVLAIAAAFVWQLPYQERERRPASRGDELARVAAVAGRQARPGDAVLFLPQYERRVSLAYPEDFAGLRDVGLRRSPAASGTLYGEDVAPAELADQLARLDARQRLWVVWDTSAVGSRWYRGQPAERARTDALDRLYREESATYVRGGAVSLYVRR
ncbi:glycosyltransferase family 39 protein [Streptomyces gamaensis]|uniref:Glycosyltransferase family 39 protein n=1 Tax=Streptomyces gamaensis TaxID=1763542 RepID=A0ABW0Z6M6_9ACTN